MAMLPQTECNRAGWGQGKILSKITDGRYFAGHFEREEYVFPSMQLKIKYRAKEAQT